MATSSATPPFPALQLRPEQASAAWLRGINGVFLARPWFDRAALFALRRYYFPLSRLWAAATLAQGDCDRFVAEARLDGAEIDQRKLLRALFHHGSASEAAAAMDAVWEEVYFSPSAPSAERLIAVETARRDCRHRLGASRRYFRPFLRSLTEIVRADAPSPADVASVYGEALDYRAQIYCPPDPMPQVAESHRVAGPGGWEHWLRFESPSARTADTVYAHVFEPKGVSNPPTLIFGHGVCVEADHWHGLIDEVDSLVAMGIRVVRPEAPWHGRRAPAGRFGGEIFVGRSPAGPLDTFTAALREWSVLMAWCRATSNGPVAMGGSSMGALMAQLAADVSRDWPVALQPDALLLITHCGRHRDAVIKGALAKVWGIARSLREAGWADGEAERYLPLLDPDPELAPVVSPENIISVLGRRDNVTPFAGGLSLLEAWGVPDENRFLWDRGHFTVPMSMIRNHEPLVRFRTRLTALGR